MTQGTANSTIICSEDIGEVTRVLSEVRETVGTPDNLGFKVREADENSTAQLVASQLGKNAYDIHALLPYGTNAQASQEIAGIVNQGYNTNLYQRGEEFRGETFHIDENGDAHYLN